ncbi:hypothetical protein [Lentibacillus salinarum]|uniref:DUF4046 domain-containing protein n=1 Tax=Lentibacillus salinarum TaxID=446820 RepID=A0ABW3ZRB2_9BACI
MDKLDRLRKMSPAELENQEVIPIYKEVIDGRRKVLPRGTWKEDQNVIVLIRYTLEIILELKQEQIPKITKSIIAKYKLWGSLNRFKSIRKLINFVYPGKFTEFDFIRVPKSYWSNLENIKKQLDHCLYEESICTAAIPKVVTHQWLVERGFSAPLKQFDHSPFKLVDAVYPGKFKEVNFKSVPQRFWNDENKIRQRFNEMLKAEGIGFYDAPLSVTQNMLIKHKLGTALKRHNGSPSKFILSLFPECFSTKDFRPPNGSWKDHDFVKITIEDLIKNNNIPRNELPKYFTRKFFKQHGLDGLLQEFNGSPIELVNLLYPNQYSITEFQRVPNKYWENKEHRIEALRSFCSKNNIERKDIPKLNRTYFHKRFPRFISIVDRHYESKFYLWIMESFPECAFQAIEFDLLIGNDGQLCDSKEELEIHNFLLDYLKEAIIVREGRRFLNSLDEETYVPDWIIYQDNNRYIVEYFGLYESTRYDGYTEKTKRKIQYYNSLSGYSFVPIMPSDFRGCGFKKIQEIIFTHGLKTPELL